MNNVTNFAPSIWVGCLACYNDGKLNGRWIEPDDYDYDEYRDSLGVCSGFAHHEELWVLDHEGFHGLLNGECSPDEAVRIAALAKECADDGYPPEALGAWVRYGHDLDLDAFRDAYSGQWDSGADFAANLFEDTTEREIVQAAEHWPFTCIDWHHAWRELEIGGDYWRTDDGYTFSTSA